MTEVPRMSTRTASPSGSPTMERRSKTRHPCKLEVYCQPITTSKSTELWWRAEVREVSLEGIGLVSSRRYEPATYICMELLDRRVPCRVAHARQGPTGGWVIGCAFLNELTKEDLEHLVRQNPAEGGKVKPAGG